jgi:hypothetical protein
MLKPKSSESSGCTHIHTSNKAKEFKQTLSAYQIADRQEWSTDGGIRTTMDHNNVKNVLRNTKNTA